MTKLPIDMLQQILRERGSSPEAVAAAVTPHEEPGYVWADAEHAAWPKAEPPKPGGDADLIRVTLAICEDCPHFGGNVRGTTFHCKKRGEDPDCQRCRGSLLASSAEEGCPIGRWSKRPEPMSFASRKGKLPGLNGMFTGTAFLVCSGPSLASVDPAKLTQPGIVTMAINNAASVIRPNLWIGCDDPDRFTLDIWQDPSILKFVPRGREAQTLFDSSTWTWTDRRVKDAPGVIYFGKRDREIVPSEWLQSDVADWGDGKCRMTMPAAIRILCSLGFTRIVLIGCDWSMDESSPYAFQQDRTPQVVAKNNRYYATWGDRFRAIDPFLKRAGVEIVNATPGSKLDVFEPVKLNDEIATSVLQQRPTDGLYTRPKPERQK